MSDQTQSPSMTLANEFRALCPEMFGDYTPSEGEAPHTTELWTPNTEVLLVFGYSDQGYPEVTYRHWIDYTKMWEPGALFVEVTTTSGCAEDLLVWMPDKLVELGVLAERKRQETTKAPAGDTSQSLN